MTSARRSLLHASSICRLSARPPIGCDVIASLCPLQFLINSTFVGLLVMNCVCVEGDSLTFHLGQKFSTRDQDNDVHPSYSCADLYSGAWWYKSCHESNLNGRYLNGTHTSAGVGVNWYHWKGRNYSLRLTEMKIKPF